MHRKIAAQLEAGDVNAREIEPGNFRRVLRDHPHLHLGGHLHLFLEGFGGDGFGEQTRVSIAAAACEATAFSRSILSWLNVCSFSV